MLRNYLLHFLQQLMLKYFHLVLCRYTPASDLSLQKFLVKLSRHRLTVPDLNVYIKMRIKQQFLYKRPIPSAINDPFKRTGYPSADQPDTSSISVNIDSCKAESCTSKQSPLLGVKRLCDFSAKYLEYDKFLSIPGERR